MIRPALAPSLQKPGSAVWASFSPILRSIAAASKTPPDVGDILAERGYGRSDFIEHGKSSEKIPLLAGPRRVANDYPAPLVVLEDGHGQGPVDRVLIEPNGVVGIGELVDIPLERGELLVGQGNALESSFPISQTTATNMAVCYRKTHPPSIRGIWN
jgi:hypothetical protein